MAEPGGYAERHDRAREVFGRFVPGVEPDRVFASMERRFGALGSFGFDAVGDLWSRAQLSRRDRSLLVLSVLSVYYGVDSRYGSSDPRRPIYPIGLR